MHAYLILAHSQPKHLARLINAISNESVDIYIHVDKSADIDRFKQYAPSSNNVYFVENRQTVTWMGFSTVVATLDLMEIASRKEYKYYNLISGADYPIKSNEYIMDCLDNSDLQLINYWKLSDRKSWLPKIEYYYHVDYMPIRGPEHKRYIHGYYWKLHHRFRKYMPKRKFIPGIESYGGAPWWSLTHDCVKYILDYVTKNKEYNNYFKYTLCPDDMFFQTIILNSGFATSSIHFQEYNEWSSTTPREVKDAENKMLPEDSFNYRYIDWSGEITGDREKPALLDNRDFKKLQASHCLFARKFDENASADLLDRIDKELR